MSNAGYSLGIDIGTTFTAVAICREGRAEIAPLGVRGWSVPSVVFIGADNAILVGDAALRRSNTDPARVAREFKRRIGDPVPLMVGGSPMSADALTGMVLRSVIDQVLALEVGDPDHAVITHPANWGPYKTDLLRQAIRMSGLDQRCPISLMTEPEAAAAHYAGSERLQTGETVAVYDLGGGTFDAAVLRTTEHGWEFLAPAEGVERLGGIDFDEAVFNHVDEMLGGAIRALDATDPAAVSGATQLRKDCVEAKEALSSDVSATISVALPNIHTEVRLTRPEFESMIRPSVEVSVDAMRRALRASQVSPADLRAVLLVGGSSRIPLISQAVSEAFQVPIAADAHPKHSVALGAALTAYHRAHVAAAPTEAIVPPAEPGGPNTGSLSRWFFGGRNGTDAPPDEARTEVVPAAGQVPFVPNRGPEDPTIGLRASGGPSGPGGPHASSSNASGPGTTGAPGTSLGSPHAGSPVRRNKVSMPLVIGIVVALIIGGVIAVITTNSDNDTATPGSGSAQTSVAASTTSESSSGDLGGPGTTSADVTPTSDSPQSSADTAVAVPPETSSSSAGTGGGLIVFESSRDGELLPSIWRINLNGTGEQKVISSTAPQADGQPSGSAQNQLAYLHRPGDTGAWELFRSSYDGSGKSRITEGLGEYSRPSWSPDGTKIAVPLQPEGKEKTDLFILDLSQNPVSFTQVTDTLEPEVDPSWSPDGAYIVYRKDLPPLGDAEIFRLTVADPAAAPLQLTNHPGYDSDPRYSPDGTKLMITRKVYPDINEEEIVWIDLNLGDVAGVNNLTNTPNQKEQDAEWVPDGSRIVYQCEIELDREICVMNADGTGQTRLTFNPGNDGTPTVFMSGG